MTTPNNTYQKTQPGFSVKEQAFFDRINYIFRLTQLLGTPPFSPYRQWSVSELQNYALNGLLDTMEFGEHSDRHLTNVHNKLDENMFILKRDVDTLTYPRMHNVLEGYHPFAMVSLEECFANLDSNFILSLHSAQNVLTAAVKRNNLQKAKSEWTADFKMGLSFEENTLRQFEAIKDFLVKIIGELQAFYSDSKTPEFQALYKELFH